MVRSKKVSLLTVSVIICILAAAVVVPAVAQDAGGADPAYKESYGKDKGDGDKCPCDRCPMDRDRMGYGGMHKGMKDVYMAVSGGSMSGDTASFSINGIGMAGGKKGIAAAVTFGSPLTGTYNTSSDMGYITMANALPMTIVVDKTGTTTMPSGNASAIIGLHGLKTLTKEKGYKVSEFKSVSVILPDGTVKYFKLDQPVRITHSMDRMMVVIDAYPSFTKRMASIFGGAGGSSFSAMGMSSMSMKDLESMEAKAQPETIGYEMPAYIAPPS